MSQPKNSGDFTAKKFLLQDYPRTLFPLKTNQFLANVGFDRLREFGLKSIREHSEHQASAAPAFLPQYKASAMKAGWHIRRTMKLDPLVETIIYDLAFGNRKIFGHRQSETRKRYGYYFQAGQPVSATSSYRGFKGACSEYKKEYKHNLSFDVASYFNSIYHT